MVEVEVREACQRGDNVAALTRLIEGYGFELQRYLLATSPGYAEAHDIYCILVEDLWHGLPSFEWRCSLRAWAYTLARHARARYAIAERRRIAREDEFSRQPWMRELVDRTRTPTPIHERSEVRDGIRKLRDHLDEPDRTLLLLRVDRDLSWRELAIVVGELGPDEDEVVAAARLRQRFQRIKQRLRDLAVAEGFLDGN